MLRCKVLQIIQLKQINSYGRANKSNLRGIKKISDLIKTNYTKKRVTDNSEIVNNSLLGIIKNYLLSYSIY